MLEEGRQGVALLSEAGFFSPEGFDIFYTFLGIDFDKKFSREIEGRHLTKTNNGRITTTEQPVKVGNYIEDKLKVPKYVAGYQAG